MNKKVSPEGVGAPLGTGKDSLAVSGAAYHNANQPAKDSIWDACREALDAELYREEYAAAKLEKAATQLGGFTKNGRDWTQQCPHCNFIVRLITEDSGIRAVSSGNCDAVPAINQWLRDEGYAS